MANIKISEMPSGASAPGAPLSGLEIVPAVKGGSNVSMAINEIRGKGAAAHPGLSVINNVDGALQRYNLTRQGTASGNVSQGFAHDPYKNELYEVHVDHNANPEKTIIEKFSGTGPVAQTSTRNTKGAGSTDQTDLGHQELEIAWDSTGTRWFFQSDHDNVSDNAKAILRFKISDDDSDSTKINIDDRQRIIVHSDSAVSYDQTQHINPCISLDGKWLITELVEAANTTTIRVFDANEVMDAANAGTFDVKDTEKFKWEIPKSYSSAPLQAMASDGAYLYIFSGDKADDTGVITDSTVTNNTIDVYTIHGDLVKVFSDVKIGRAEAATDGDGEKYEVEGAGWVWHQGQVFLSTLITSGNPGSRVNRIWLFGGNIFHPATGGGANNMAALVESGTWTPTFHDTSDNQTAGSSVVSGSNNYVKMGPMVWIQLNVENAAMTGLTGSNNFIIKGLPYTVAHRAPLGSTLTNNYDFYSTPDNRGLPVAEALIITDSADGPLGSCIQFMEIRDNAEKVITNVEQFSSKDFRFAGWYRTND